MDDEVIREQIEYYRRKAPEYDAGAIRGDHPLVAYGRVIDEALRAFRPAGTVLEIACGTGNGTRRLLEHADSVTALDSSPEVLDAARKKVDNDARVNFIEANAFDWEPDGTFDVVYFRYWLTHVPLDRFDAFWNLVDRALKPGGRVFFEDDMEGAFEEERVDGSPSLVRRPAGSEGEVFLVVKIFWEPTVLQETLRSIGWDVEVRASGPLMWGQGGRLA